VLLAGELYLYLRYASLDGQFHFWLHGLLGSALGLVVLTALRLASATRQWPTGLTAGS
jgi:hypothetical protein